MPWDEGLTEDQKAAAGAPRGHVVLLAGPGTGKTFVLIRRIEHLVEAQGVPPKHILALAFTRAAAAEMRHRLEEGMSGAGLRVKASTIHSFALRELLREGAADLPAPVRVVDDWEERNIVVEELARYLGRTVSEIGNQRGTGALDRLADDWDTLRADGTGWEEGFPDARFLTAWRQHRSIYGYTLRSELVYQLLTELRSNPGFTPTDAAAILVDEYQDLNRCELRTIKELARRADAEVFAAGDDDQSIYLFRHAHPTGIRRFDEDYDSADKRILKECLRCGPAIVDLANWLIRQELDREQKELISITEWAAAVRLVQFQNQEAEALGVARMVDAEISRGTAPEQVLILIKADSHGRISEAITNQLKALDRKAYRPRAQSLQNDEIQILIEYLVLAQGLRENRIDEMSLRALFSLESNRIGGDRLWRIAKLALDRGLLFSEALAYAAANPDEFPKGHFAALINEQERILEQARYIERQEDEQFDAWLTRVCDKLGIGQDAFDLVVAATHQVSSELADELKEVEVASGGTADAPQEEDAPDFLHELRVSLTQLSETLPAQMPDHVTITTMHGAKGLSADLVFVLQAEDEVIPDDLHGDALDEARRLLYVSLTRARKKLVIGHCARRTGPQRFVGRTEATRRTFTRFLRDYGMVAVTADDYLQELDASSESG